MGWLGSLRKFKAKIYTCEQEESGEFKEINGGRRDCIMN